MTDSQPGTTGANSPTWLFLALVGCGLLAGCQALGDSEARDIIIEGIVVRGDTYRVDPITDVPALESETGIPATLELRNEGGQRVEVRCDEAGRFRLGPIRVAGRAGDQLTVRCPGARGLCLSALSPPVVAAAASLSATPTEGTQPVGVEPTEPIVVRWRISLPDITDVGKAGPGGDDEPGASERRKNGEARPEAVDRG